MTFGTPVLVLICLCVSVTLGHPLGNFTINHFALLNPGREQIKLRYVIDMAEIPTLQELQKLGDGGQPPTSAELQAYANRMAAEYAQLLLLQVDNAPVTLTLTAVRLNRAAGAAGLQTMRIECDLSGPLPSTAINGHSLRFEDRNYPENRGWREIVVRPEPGIAVFNSSIFGSSQSDELKNYPNDQLMAPLNERVADLSFSSGTLPAGARPLLTRTGAPFVAPQTDRLGELLHLPNLTISLALLGMLIALLWGGLHALSPGHGKTIVAAYLVGERGTVRHALFLGLTVTITHTAGVILLGLITLLASAYILPERLFAPLQLVSGLMVLLIGFTLFRQRLSAALGLDARSHTHLNGETHSHSVAGAHHHAHEHSVAHSHDSDDHAFVHSHGGEAHSHLPPGADGGPVSWRNLLSLGIAGGILPCPSALVVLLAANSAQRAGFGLLLVLAFSAGLAGVLSAVGILFVYAGRVLKPVGRFYRLEQVLPIFSALVIAGAGVFLCYGALGQIGLFG
jgi:ABC-type nickel/cobalt efflux system permease component RcnA